MNIGFRWKSACTSAVNTSGLNNGICDKYKCAKWLRRSATDRLCLVNAAGLPEFRPVYDAFSQMGFYNLNPDKIRDIQSHRILADVLTSGRRVT